MKRVLLLLPGAFSGFGGIETYNRQVIRAFLELGQEHGFRVTTLIRNDRSEDVDDKYIPPGATRPVGCGRRSILFGTSALRCALKEKPDLIVLGHVHFARIARLLKAISPSSRLWCVAYGIEVWHPLKSSVRKGLALVEKVLSISDFSRRELAKTSGVPWDRIEILPCALDPVWQAQFLPRPVGAPERTGPPALLTVARLAASERYKGVDSVLRALPEVLREVTDLTYDVVGDGDDRYRLEALAQELGIADHVRFRGSLRPDELAAAYRDCTFFVMPSSHEGFGIVFLEAALFGKPSIGGRHGGTPEVIEDGATGILVDREDVSEVATALIRLLSDEVERTRMGDAARRRLLERFTFGSLRASMKEHLNGMVSLAAEQAST